MRSPPGADPELNIPSEGWPRRVRIGDNRLVPLLLSLARHVALATRGPCPACGARRGAPLCADCRRASGVGSTPPAAELGDGRLYFVGAYRVPGAARRLTPIGLALGNFKDRGDRYAGRCLARLLAEACAPLAAACQSVVPVPADAGRLRRRACSPSAWLARELARRCGLPLCTTALRRSDHRPAQRELGGALRRRNARGAFALGRDRLQGYSVILVDDVATTGATLGDAARCLHEGGAAAVVRLALACADEKASLECLSRTGSTGSSATAYLPR